MDSDDTGKGESRFNFYLVALDFSVLGLALQTFKTDKGVTGQPWEPFAWLCLLVSALCALSYVEWASKQSDRAAVSERLLRQQQPSGDYLAYLQQQKLRLDAQISARRLSDRLKYNVAKWAFLLGILSLAVSRTLSNLSSAGPLS